MIDHAVVLVVPSGPGPYAAHVYQVEGGTQLARAEVELGERDPDDAFGELARALYDQISFEPPEPPPPPKLARKKKRPFYKKWWFWTGVGAAVATGVALPLLLSGDGAPEVGCPPGESCGLVVLSF
jgi:hypothetical protein